ncbi:hypothetical protein ACFSQJ_03915 [Croceitalea marina]|uniref:Tandem five-TM protein n=1 Tax=Croceitalea marina TaxID=1775166 RepID=A0ABW5MS72_9FLAO
MFKKILKRLSSLIFTAEQKRIISDCKVANNEEHSQWFLNNVLFPLIVIGFPLMMYFFIPSKIKNWETLVFNGSISLLGINILFSMSSYLIKFQKIGSTVKSKDEEDKQEKDKISVRMYHLRSRLDIYKNVLILTGGILYFTQVFFIMPDNNWSYYFFVVITVIILIVSIYIGRYMFIIRDDFFQKTFYKELKGPIVDNKNRWQEKYGQTQ